ncbi:helix-turn-helix family protein [Trabulsiella guamensis ATCC 49490]|uniref:Helix-turn-helix family protein n=1 Tax=Trabulsiella guamensis ATCC 49490 TaxID=1005994 RepID=A0A085A7Z8_9ENTR|nr:helix-turn-helix transcriptional regulator [Trabulsiella guamensis]KFC06343.1 helix-turn-helix family protein [Trabulsiella guamensis ATCC 49490]
MEKWTFAQRLKIAMAEQGLNQSSLAVKVGVSQAAIQKLTSGRARSTTKLLALANALNVNPSWLESGSGPMRNIDSEQLLISNRNQKSEIAKTRLKAVVWEDMEQTEDGEFVHIPLINVNFSAGLGSCEVIDDESFSLVFRKYSLHKMGVSASQARLVRVSGDSMSPTLSDGDIVGINMAETEIRDGKTYAICHDDMLRIKTLVARPGEILIRSLNRDLYPDEVLDVQKFHSNVRVIGRVFWSSHTW